MRRLLIVAHLLGLTMFLGSVFGHIVAGIVGGAPGTAAFLAAREEIAAATQALTMPGLGLTILSGLGLAAVSRLSPIRHRWLAAHAGLAVAIVIIAATVIVPTGMRTLAEARAFALGEAGASLAGVTDALSLEHAAGAFSVALAFLVICLGVFKPRIAARLRGGGTSVARPQ
jgi:hypothetical protein